MELEKALEWAKQQSVVRVRAFKENEEDKFTFMVGEYLVSPLMFDTQEEAEKYLDDLGIYWDSDKEYWRKRK